MSTNTTVQYKVAAGRTVVLPRELGAGPGATNLRFEGGVVLELPAAAARHRFIRNRIALGDLVAVTAPAPTRATATKE